MRLRDSTYDSNYESGSEPCKEPHHEPGGSVVTPDFARLEDRVVIKALTCTNADLRVLGDR